MTSFLRRLLPKNIPNTSSQQRDHHANERTFLSWTRAGLGFAAMALALDRLDSIDRVISAKIPSLEAALLQSSSASSRPAEASGARLRTDAGTPSSVHDSRSSPSLESSSKVAPSSSSPRSVFGFSESVSASRLCQLLGLWSLGYGFFRYVSMRQYLLRGQFVPALWGPVLMTAGSFGAFMMLGLQMDRRRASHV